MIIARFNVYYAVFWLVLILMTVFMLLLIGGLFIYGNWTAITDICHNAEFHFAIIFTLWTTVLATLLAGLTAIPCGYLLARYNFPGKVLVDTLMDVPIVLPPLVSGVALLILFGPILGDSLAKIGLDIVFSERGVVVAQWFIATPFAIKTFKNAFSSIDLRLEKMARTLGYPPEKVFLRVSLPLAKNGLLGGLTMAWARTLGEFGATAMLAGIVRMKTETLSVAVFLNMSIGDLQFSLVMAIIMLLLALALLTILKIVTKTEVHL
ncbi:NifC-like ABC-type porter [Desulfoscipio gibsoniae DSM 7213]|uniref:NifC-like ABC-type porter n=2 Tax=Desulfoscipio gibsoniae TaxID=102134 RepID=R4K9M5_9FIRM|nr:NifC-like ABC-type porter [Desulfoscipio gibsoniae DSM 7213]